MSKKKNISFETYIPQGRFEKSKILNQNKTKIYKSLENKKREIEFTFSIRICVSRRKKIGHNYIERKLLMTL